MDESPSPVAGSLPATAGFPQLRHMACDGCDVKWRGEFEPCWMCGHTGRYAIPSVVPGAATYAGAPNA